MDPIVFPKFLFSVNKFWHKKLSFNPALFCGLYFGLFYPLPSLAIEEKQNEEEEKKSFLFCFCYCGFALLHYVLLA